jgi:hypothetical protein
MFIKRYLLNVVERLLQSQRAVDVTGRDRPPLHDGPRATPLVRPLNPSENAKMNERDFIGRIPLPSIIFAGHTDANRTLVLLRICSVLRECLRLFLTPTTGDFE